MRVAVVVVLCVPLAGCFGLWPPKPLPDWAMSRQAEVSGSWRAEGRSVSAPRRTKRTVAADPLNLPPADVLPFSADWLAREKALDDKLRRSMDICRGC